MAILSTEWFAERADLKTGRADFKNLYNSAYAVLSESVHANVRDLDPLLDLNDAGEIVRLRYEAETAN
jgi:hypothetical protein